MYPAKSKHNSKRRPSIFDLPIFPPPQSDLLQNPYLIKSHQNTKIKTKPASKLPPGLSPKYSRKTSVRPNKKRKNLPSLQAPQPSASDNSRSRESQPPSTPLKARTSIPLSPSPRHPQFPRIQRRSTVFSTYASNIPVFTPTTMTTPPLDSTKPTNSNTHPHPQTYNRPLAPSKIQALKSTYATLTSRAKNTSTTSTSSLSSIPPSQIRLSHILDFLKQDLQAATPTATSPRYSDSEPSQINAITQVNIDTSNRLKHESDLKFRWNANFGHPCLTSGICKLTPQLVRCPHSTGLNSDVPILVRWTHEGRYCYISKRTHAHSHNPRESHIQRADIGVAGAPVPAQDILTLYSHQQRMPPSIRRLLLTGNAASNNGIDERFRRGNRGASQGQDRNAVRNKPFGKEGIDWEIDGEGTVWVRDDRGGTGKSVVRTGTGLDSAWWVRWDGC